MRTNISQVKPIFTHEGAPSSNVSPLQRLKRLSMACMLWEDTFYVDGKLLVEQMEDVCKLIDGNKIVDVAIDAHKKGLLRHVPLFLLLQAIKKKAKCIDAIYEICSRPDQMTELLSLYWKQGKCPLSAQLKKGLAKAFTRFDEYQLAKYNRDNPIKLKDVLFLCHAKPKDEEQAELWKRLISNTLKTPETWETKLSAGEDKKESFKELLEKKKMGKLAILRNLRNLSEAGVDRTLIESNLLENPRPMLPFQFLAAAIACPVWEDMVDRSMIASAEKKEKLNGMTAVFVDVSGSMDAKVSGKSEISRKDAAAGIAILLRECCENVEIFSFSEALVLIPLRHGMALRDAIKTSQHSGGTYLGKSLTLFLNNRNSTPVHRIIVITDEQTHDVLPKMNIPNCYVLNVGTFENGIKNNGEWMTINGFSEHVIDYIREIETVSCDE